MNTAMSSTSSFPTNRPRMGFVAVRVPFKWSLDLLFRKRKTSQLGFFPIFGANFPSVVKAAVSRLLK